MEESFVQGLFADRIGGNQFGKGTAVYKFGKIKRARAEAAKLHPKIEELNFGIGEPHNRPADDVIFALYGHAMSNPKHGYTDLGTDEFREEVAKYMSNVFGVEGLNPVTEIVPTIGSKEALGHLPWAFINPSAQPKDLTIMTIPGYPVAGTHTKYAGGEVLNLPLRKERGFLPDLESIAKEDAERAKLIVVNYPNNPTGARATPEFYRELVDFAKQHKIIVAADEAYATIVYDGKPTTFLATSGAKDVGIALHSFSKSYNMTGWRLGFAAGNELVIKGLAEIKENVDSGSWESIQKAGIYAMQHPERNDEINAEYSRRMDLLVGALNQIGLKAEKPAGTFYLFMQAPKGIVGGQEFKNAEEFSQYLIREKRIINVPWDESGQPHVRFAATFKANGVEEEKQVMAKLVDRLKDCKFYF